MEVLSSFVREPGTIVKEENTVEKMLIRGIARDNDVARIALVNIDDKPGKAFQIFSILAKKKVNVDVILQSIGRDGSKDISFTVSQSDLEAALNIINENNAIIGCEKVLHDESVSKVSVVGAGMTSNPGVAATMFEALYDAGINIHMISTSEIRVSVLIDQKDAENAVRAIHSKFNLND
jgi:aspartate kinase